MGNTSYLCCSELRRTYPSFDNPRFKPDQHTVACARAAIPLLWLGLFRRADLRRDRFVVDGEAVTERAPLATTRAALARLPAATARLAALFPGGGALDEHAALLAAAVRDAGGRHVTIELEEIAALWPSRARFDAALDRALAHVEGGRVRGARAAVLALTQLHDGRRFPPAVGLYDRRRPPRIDAENLARLLGAAHCRPVPWERTAPRTKPAAPPLHAAALAGDAAGVTAALAARAPGRGVADRALEAATAKGHRAIVRALAGHASDLGRARALRVALSRRHEAVARTLLAAGADPNGYDVFTGSCWQHVLWGNVSPRMLGELVRAGGDVGRKHPRGGYPIVAAAWVGRPGPLRAMLRLGADPHVRDPFKRPPLAIAARCGHVDAVAVLVSAGATAEERATAAREARRAIADPLNDRARDHRRAVEAAIELLEASPRRRPPRRAPPVR